MLTRIADGGGRKNERWRRAMETRDAQQATHHVGEVRAEDAAIRVQLVDDDVLQVGEEPRPPRMVRHDAGMQHVGVGEKHTGALTRNSARIVGSVAIVRDRPDLQIGIADHGA